MHTVMIMGSSPINETQHIPRTGASTPTSIYLLVPDDLLVTVILRQLARGPVTK